MNSVDKALLDGLAVLTDTEVGRVQAHLAAGLPMIVDWGYGDNGDEPATCGCLVGVAVPKFEAFLGPRAVALSNLTSHGFIQLVHDTDWSPDGAGGSTRMCTPVNQAVRDRLAALLDMEWSRRHPLPVETGKTLATNRQLQEVGS